MLGWASGPEEGAALQARVGSVCRERAGRGGRRVSIPVIGSSHCRTAGLGGGGVLTPSLPCREIPPHCSLALGWSAPSWELGGDSHKGKAAGLMAPGTALEGLKLA